MNKIRRKELAVIISKLDEARCRLEEVLADEQDAFDSMPESLQASERGETMEEGIYTMEEKMSDLEDMVEALEELANG